MPLSPDRPFLCMALVLVFGVIGMVSPLHADIVDLCAWTGSPVEPASDDVMMTPVVADLNGDGIPDVIFISYVDSPDINRGEDGILRAISGDDCRELFSVADPGVQRCVDGATMDLDERADIGFLSPGAGLAVGDIDGDGRVEIVGLLEGPFTGQPVRIVLFEDDGSIGWCSEAVGGRLHHLSPPAIADLDGDGMPEIIVGSRVFNADGTLRWEWQLSPHLLPVSTVADLDLDGCPEVVVGRHVYRADGSLFWERLDIGPLLALPGVADFDLDGQPEVVIVAAQQKKVYLLEGRTGATRCITDVPEDPACPDRHDGGPPTLADIDGDCIPEIGVAGGAFFTLYRYAPDPSGGTGCLVPLWSQPTRDCSSGVTGSTMFDLEEDGSVEVLYNDELRFRIWRASDGAVLLDIPNGSGTLLENPTLVDVNADGEAEIVISANDYAFGDQEGIRILHDPDATWTPTRRIYNQHAYHITNVEEDGTIPAVEESNWERFNNFRVQAVPSACLVSCEPRTQGFWRRQCRGPHPSGEPDRLATYVDRVNDTATFAHVAGREGICAALRSTPPNDKCAQAEAQFMALLLNVASGRLVAGCGIDTPLSSATTVGGALAEIDALLSDPARRRADCVRAQALADDVNTGRALQ